MYKTRYSSVLHNRIIMQNMKNYYDITRLDLRRLSCASNATMNNHRNAFIVSFYERSIEFSSVQNFERYAFFFFFFIISKGLVPVYKRFHFLQIFLIFFFLFFFTKLLGETRFLYNNIATRYRGALCKRTFLIRF